jgi:HK97 gp10 family phage protein
MSYTVKISGLDEVEKNLENFTQKVARKDVRHALIAGANVLKESAQANAPVLGKATPQRTPGELKESIDVFTHVDVSAGTVTCKVGPGYDKTGKGGEQSPGVYGKFVELGTSKAGAEPYLRPAFDTSGEAAVERTIAVLREETGL